MVPWDLPFIFLNRAFYRAFLFSVRTCKTRILDVVYNASNNELVRTKTLVKNAIVVVSNPWHFFFL